MDQPNSKPLERRSKEYKAAKMAVIQKLPPVSHITPAIWISTWQFTSPSDFFEKHPVTAVLSVMEHSLGLWEIPGFQALQQRGRHLYIQCDDSKTQDMLVHFGRICDFLDAALGHPDASSSSLQFLEGPGDSAPTGPTTTDMAPANPYLEGTTPASAPSTTDMVPSGVAAAPPSLSADAVSADERTPLVVVHCVYGRSRSVTCVVAYLMKKTGKSPDEVLTGIRRRRPDAKPSSNLMRQLAVWAECGYRVWGDAEGTVPNPAYAVWLEENRKKVENLPAVQW